MNVLVTGGTGFVGNLLVDRLSARGDSVTILTRSPDSTRSARARVEYALWPVDVAGFDAVVNLAGAGVLDRRWNDAYKVELRASRIDLTRRLVDAIAAAKTRPRVLVSASAVGYYGDRGEEELPESAGPADAFLAQLCVDWEAEAQRAATLGVRVARVRIGLVLGRNGGALATMLPIFRLGLGGPFGFGRAWFPWIHVDDLCRFILHALDREHVSGAFNGTAPGIVRNKEYAATLGRVLSRPAFLPVPKVASRIVLGEVAPVLTGSQHTIPERTLAAGFAFQWPELEPALRNLLSER